MYPDKALEALEKTQHAEAGAPGPDGLRYIGCMLAHTSRRTFTMLLGGALLPVAAWSAKPNGPYKSSGKAPTVQVDVELYVDQAQVEQLITNSMNGYVVVAKVKVTPLRPKEPVRLFRDDFVLVSSKDGQRSEPFAPEHLAGSSSMVVGQTMVSAGPIAGQQHAPVWGSSEGESNRRLGTKPSASSKAASADQEAWLKLLKEKVLRDGVVTQPVEGLLYFPLEGKHKPKQLTLLYNGTWPKLELPFSEK